MKSFICLVIFFFAGLGHAYGASHFRICAFNLHSFGEAKAKKSSVMRTLTQIIARCDVTLLQEVRDRKERALSELLERLNRFQAEHRYQAVASQRLGRSDSYQEQYVFVYRADTATVTGHYQSPDNRPGDVDAFAREPFVVRFRAPKTAIKEFVLIPQHTAPANTSKELDALYDVLQDVRKMWKTEDVMLLGDFNADCAYHGQEKEGEASADHRQKPPLAHRGRDRHDRESEHVLLVRQDCRTRAKIRQRGCSFFSQSF
uniref:Deoxyribonuclease-1-like 1 n=1 Tax=Tetraodon nigroviridis TaxID=99883 RepID=H3CH87_TETNG